MLTREEQVEIAQEAKLRMIRDPWRGLGPACPGGERCQCPTTGRREPVGPSPAAWEIE